MEAWWADDPIRAAADDSLGRASFVGRVVETIQQVGKHKSSTVVGLTGPWGSGKTSTANLVIAALREIDWGVAVLNPWAVGATDAIVAELLNSVAAALPPEAKTARKKLVAYTEYALPLLSLVPYVGSPLQKAGELLQKRLRGEDTLQARLVEVENELATLKRPVLVFVDDLDRLQPDQLLALFRAVRVLGRLPYVHYLVPYDQITLLDLLQATPVADGRPDRALAFLEKIVTIRMMQPAIRPKQSALLFHTGLKGLLTDLDASLSREEEQRLEEEWKLLLARDLVEPRTIRRFLAQLTVYLPLTGVREVDPVDFVVITHLRSAYPAVFEAVRSDRSVLAARPADVEDDRLTDWREGERLDGLGLSTEQARRLHSAVRRLFPVLLGHEIRRRSVADPDYVDRYFTFLRDETDLTDAELRSELQTWATSDDLRPAEKLHRALLSPRSRRPPSEDPHYLSADAGLIRRLDTVTDQLDETACQQLLPKVVTLALLPATPDLVGGPDAALVQWIAHLLRAAASLDKEALVRQFDQPASTAIPLLRAVVAALHDDRLGRLNGLRKDHLEELARRAGEAAFVRFRENVHKGDMAPDEPMFNLFAVAEDLLGSPRVNALLLAAVADPEITIDAIGARLVKVGPDPASKERETLSFDAAGLAERLGNSLGSDARTSLIEVTNEPEPGGRTSRVIRRDPHGRPTRVAPAHQERPTPWASRRRYAARRLIEVIPSADAQE